MIKVEIGAATYKVPEGKEIDGSESGLQKVSSAELMFSVLMQLSVWSIDLETKYACGNDENEAENRCAKKTLPARNIVCKLADSSVLLKFGGP